VHTVPPAEKKSTQTGPSSNEPAVTGAGLEAEAGQALSGVGLGPSPLPNDPFADRARHWIDDEDDEGLVIRPINRKSEELDLIPMVDCVFLLLVFYMITSSYALQKTIDVAPPSPDKKGAVQAVQSPSELAESSIIVQIDARNKIFVDDVALSDPSALGDTLRAKMNGEQKNELVVEADPRSLHETVVAVIDAAHDLHFQKVRMATTVGEGD
jgi:biopolymer transport protein ExbD